MLDINEVETLSKSLFTLLKIENCFKKTNFHERYGNQLIRIGHQFNNLRRKTEIGNNHLSDYLEWHNQKIPHMPMKDHDFLVEIVTLVCTMGLVHYEFLKRFFIETLFLDKLSTKTGINLGNRPTYGKLAEAFLKLHNMDSRMEELLDNDFRNALAHDTWYFEDKSLKYNNLKNQIISIPYELIPQKVKIIYGLYVTITKEYFKEYFPELEKEYNELRQKINDIFPLY